MHLLHPAHIQGTIYIYTTAGKPVKEAKLIKTKVGVVTGLTLDPVKQVLERIGISSGIFPPKVVFWSDETTMALRHCTYLGSDCGVVATSQQMQPTGDFDLY